MKFAFPNIVQYSCEETTGIVLDSNQYVTTQISGGHNNTAVSSHNIQHNQFWIKEASGKETLLYFRNLNSQPRVGQKVSVLTINAKQGDEQKRLAVSLINHSAVTYELLTPKPVFKDETFERLQWCSTILFIGIAVMGFILVVQSSGMIYHLIASSGARSHFEFSFLVFGILNGLVLVCAIRAFKSCKRKIKAINATLERVTAQIIAKSKQLASKP